MTVLDAERLAAGHSALRLRNDLTELPRARRFADAAAQRVGLSLKDREDFRLATSEAVANAIEHGCPCWDGAIHVWTFERPAALTLGVRNGGEFDFKVPAVDELAERGRGLTLIADLVDVVSVSRGNGHTQLELTKERPDGDR
jgi:anti-sigma regulatory factor (Ser/Thr protein kinase)